MDNAPAAKRSICKMLYMWMRTIIVGMNFEKFGGRKKGEDEGWFC